MSAGTEMRASFGLLLTFKPVDPEMTVSDGRLMVGNIALLVILRSPPTHVRLGILISVNTLLLLICR